MKIRKIEASDYPQILEIYNYYIINTTINFEQKPITILELSEKVDKILKKYPFIVLEDGNIVIGYAYLAEFNPRTSYNITANLSIYLKPDIESKGYGTMLLKEIEKLAREQNIINIISIITEENTYSVKFHLKHDFREVGVLDKVGYKFGRYLSVTYFQKKL